jgi:hypothetical protein
MIKEPTPPGELGEGENYETKILYLQQKIDHDQITPETAQIEIEKLVTSFLKDASLSNKIKTELIYQIGVVLKIQSRKKSAIIQEDFRLIVDLINDLMPMNNETLIEELTKGLKE